MAGVNTLKALKDFVGWLLHSEADERRRMEIQRIADLHRQLTDTDRKDV